MHIDGSASCSTFATVKAVQSWLCPRGGLLWYVVCVLSAQMPASTMAQSSPDVIWSLKTHSNYIAPVAISTDGALVASAGTNNTIRLAKLTNGSVVRYLFGHVNGVTALAFSPDGSVIASTSYDRTLRLWNVSAGTLLRTIPQGGGVIPYTASAVAFHPDGQHVAADRNRTNVVLWRISDGTSVWETLGNTTEIESIAISLDGSLVAAAGGYRGQDVLIRIIRAADGQPLQSLITSNAYGVRQLAFSPDGKWLAAGCDRLTNFDGQVEVWRVADWIRERVLPVHSPALAFTPDGKLLVTLRDKAMEFWRMSEGKLMFSYGAPTNGDYSPHLSIAISPKSDRIVIGNSRFLLGGVPEASATAIRFPMMFHDVVQNGNAGTFSWTGGHDQYQIQRRSFDSASWMNVGSPTTNRSIILPLDGLGAMFRVMTVVP